MQDLPRFEIMHVLVLSDIVIIDDFLKVMTQPINLIFRFLQNVSFSRLLTMYFKLQLLWTCPHLQKHLPLCDAEDKNQDLALRQRGYVDRRSHRGECFLASETYYL